MLQATAGLRPGTSGGRGPQTRSGDSWRGAVGNPTEPTAHNSPSHNAAAVLGAMEEDLDELSDLPGLRADGEAGAEAIDTHGQPQAAATAAGAARAAQRAPRGTAHLSTEHEILRQVMNAGRAYHSTMDNIQERAMENSHTSFITFVIQDRVDGKTIQRSRIYSFGSSHMVQSTADDRDGK